MEWILESEFWQKPGQEHAEANKAPKFAMDLKTQMPEPIFNTKSPCIDCFLKEEEHTFAALLSLLLKEILSQSLQSLVREASKRERWHEPWCRGGRA